MRPGLALTGVAIVVIGLAVALSALALSSTPSGSQSSNNRVELTGFSSYDQLLTGSNQSSAEVILDWSATVSLQVSFYRAAACPAGAGFCPSGGALASWWGTSGRYSGSGATTAPWIVEIRNPNGTASWFNDTFLESYPAGGSSFHPSWDLVVALAGAIVLVVIGGLALFLGVFLRGGVYSREATSLDAVEPPELDDLEDDELGPDGPPDAGRARDEGDD